MRLQIREIFLALSMTGLLAGGCSKPLSDTEYLAKAKESLNQGDLRTSMIDLKNALRQNPGNIEARRLLGKVYLKTGNGAAAEKELRRAIDLGLAKEAVLLPLAEALQLQGRNQEILDEIEIPASIPPQDQATLAAYRGDAWLALGKKDKARFEYQRALTLDPHSPRGKLGMAYLTAPDNIEDALRLIDEGLAEDPQDGHLWRYRAKLLEYKGDLQGAEAAYDKTIALLGGTPEDLANRTLIHIRLKKFDLAQQEIGILKKAAPKYYLTHFSEGYLKIARNAFGEAIPPLETALKLNPKYPPILFYLGLAYLKQGSLEQADQQLSRFRQLRPDTDQGYKFLALVKFLQKDYKPARKLLIPLILSNPEDRFALKLMADIETADGNLQEALRYLKKLAVLDPEDPLVRTRLGNTLLASGEKEAGIKTLEEAAANAATQDTPQPDIALILAYIKEKRFSKAAEAIQRLKAKLPDHPLPLNLEALWHQAQGQETEAIQALESALERSPNDPVTSEHLAQALLRRGQGAKARHVLESAMKAHPDNANLRLALARLQLREKRFEALEDNLQTLLVQHPESLEARLLLAKYYLQFGQPQRAQTILEAILPRHPDQPALLSLLAKAQLETKLAHRALQTAKHLIEADPNSPMGHYLAAQAQIQLGDFKDFRRELESALKISPDFLPARRAWIKLLALEGKTGEVERELTQLTEAYPQDPQILALSAWWAMKQHDFGKAIALYEKILKQHPTTRTIQDLAKALWQNGNRAEAVEQLERWHRQRPKDSGALYLLALMYQALAEEDKALQTLQQVLEISPNHVLALNDLAWHLRRENPRQALAYAEKAHDIAPNAAWIADTFGAVLLENGHPRQALQILEKAARLAPRNPSIRYHLALAHHRLGQDAAAIANLERALAADARFAERSQAQSLLDKLRH